MMRKFTVLLTVSIISASTAVASPQQMRPEAHKYLQQALETMKENALHPKETDWKVLTEQSFLRAETAQIPADTYPAIIYACAQLRKQEQCFLSLPDSTSSDLRKKVADALIANSPPTRQGMSLAPSPFTDRKEPQLAMLQGPKGKVWAYLVVPECRPTHTDVETDEPFLAAWSAALRFFIIEGYGAHGWIIDLRGNEGGNSWAAMAALGPLLGEGSLGAFVDKGVRRVWFYKNGQLSLQTTDDNGNTHDSIMRTVGGPHVDLSTAAVAVLLDNATAGSGEQIAIAFAGRKKERSFGLPTMGYSACCTRYRLSDGAFLNMEMGITEDRNGRAYSEGVKPDVRIETGADTSDRASDPVIRAASEWLSNVQ